MNCILLIANTITDTCFLRFDKTFKVEKKSPLKIIKSPRIDKTINQNHLLITFHKRYCSRYMQLDVYEQYDDDARESYNGV